jgi:hypothetical protein
MKEIKLSQNKVAIVDDEDYEFLSEFTWYAQRNRTIFYAYRQYNILMHRVIIKAKKGDLVDHINGDGLDNRKSNLRIATNQQNQRNRHIVWSSSGYKGVSYDKERDKFSAGIRIDGKTIHLGRYNTAIEAAIIYDEAALEKFGDFARLNFGVEGLKIEKDRRL